MTETAAGVTDHIPLIGIVFEVAERVSNAIEFIDLGGQLTLFCFDDDIVSKIANYYGTHGR